MLSRDTFKLLMTDFKSWDLLFESNKIKTAPIPIVITAIKIPREIIISIKLKPFFFFWSFDFILFALKIKTTTKTRRYIQKPLLSLQLVRFSVSPPFFFYLKKILGR